MTGLERQRMIRDASGQGLVYAVALAAVLVIFLLASLGPGGDRSPRPAGSDITQPPLFPANPGR